MLSIPAKEPQDDRGEEANELLFVFHLTLKMLSQCVPRPWLEWAGKAYISRRFALRLFFLLLCDEYAANAAIEGDAGWDQRMVKQRL